jgi:phosphomannomutase
MLYFAEPSSRSTAASRSPEATIRASYNGFKMVLRHEAFYGDRIQELGRIAEIADWEEGAGLVSERDVMDHYVDRIMEDFDGGPFRVGWDAGNGAGGPVLERLVMKLPGEHHLLYTELDGTFPEPPPRSDVEANLEI